MTKVYYREYYDKTLLTVEGHCGFDTVGNDIVCAGISAITFAFVNSILDEEVNGRLRLHRNIVRDGYICFEIEKFDFSKARISGIIDSFLTGIMMLADIYPQYIRME